MNDVRVKKLKHSLSDGTLFLLNLKVLDPLKIRMENKRDTKTTLKNLRVRVRDRRTL